MANKRVKAQVALEFTAAFICLLIFLVATTKIFVWFGSNIINRNRAYEDTRKVLREKKSSSVEGEEEYKLIMPKEDFYPSKSLNIFGKTE